MADKSKEVRRNTLRTFNEVDVLLKVLTRNIEKLNQVEDPAVKFSMMTLFFDMMFDTGLTMILELVIKDSLENLLPEDEAVVESSRDKLNTQIDMTREITDDFFKKMRNWVVSPTYSPDSGLGNKIMKDGNKEFVDKFQG